MKPLLTVAEAAALVRREKQTIYRWIKSGKLREFDSDRGKLVQSRQVLRVAGETRVGRPPTERRET